MRMHGNWKLEDTRTAYQFVPNVALDQIHLANSTQRCWACLNGCWVTWNGRLCRLDMGYYNAFSDVFQKVYGSYSEGGKSTVGVGLSFLFSGLYCFFLCGVALIQFSFYFCWKHLTLLEKISQVVLQCSSMQFQNISNALYFEVIQRLVCDPLWMWFWAQFELSKLKNVLKMLWFSLICNKKLLFALLRCFLIVASHKEIAKPHLVENITETWIR